MSDTTLLLLVLIPGCLVLVVIAVAIVVGIFDYRPYLNDPSHSPLKMYGMYAIRNGFLTRDQEIVVRALLEDSSLIHDLNNRQCRDIQAALNRAGKAAKGVSDQDEVRRAFRNV